MTTDNTTKVFFYHVDVPDDAAATSAGVDVGQLYRNGSVVMIRTELMVEALIPVAVAAATGFSLLIRGLYTWVHDLDTRIDVFELLVSC